MGKRPEPARHVHAAGDDIAEARGSPPESGGAPARPMFLLMPLAGYTDDRITPLGPFHINPLDPSMWQASR